jgi:hypothetical protein
MHHNIFRHYMKAIIQIFTKFNKKSPTDIEILKKIGKNTMVDFLDRRSMGFNARFFSTIFLEFLLE